MVKKIFTWAFVAFLLFFVAYRPASAANVAKIVGNGLIEIARGVGDFLGGVAD